MNITFEAAKRAAGYYCAVRDLEDRLERELNDINGDLDGYLSHPHWYKLSDQLNDEWALTEEEQAVLSFALEAGLCDYFGPEDIMEVAS